MKPLLVILTFFTAAALACGNPSNSCQNGYGNASAPFLETLHYSLEQLKLEDNSDIKTAIRIYKKEVRSLENTIPIEAFAGGNFNPGAYALGSADAQILKAQIDLFDTIYLILNDEQKKQLPVLIGMYQHHMKYISASKSCSGGKKECERDKNKSCGSKSCDTPKSVKLTPKR